MNKVCSFLALSAFFMAPLSANAMFSGDTKLACEALLCLSSGKRPKECRPAIKKYFSISAKKFSDTLKNRKNFLKLCPSASEDPKMAALTEAIANGAGRCDYAALNSQLLVSREGEEECSFIRDQLPGYCSAYSGNAYADVKEPRYVGVPELGGFWVEADKYDAALLEYNSRVKLEAAERIDCR